MTTGPSEIVTRLMAAVAGADREAAMALLAPDFRMVRMPFADTEQPGGRERVARTVELFAAAARETTWTIGAQVCLGDTVLHERVDRTEWSDGTVTELPVAGAFTVRGGQVVEWRDYYDATYLDRVTGGWSALRAKLLGESPS